MPSELIKKYGVLAITILIAGYGVYLLWFLYSSIYKPLFIDQATQVDSNQYVIPDASITSVRELLNVKTTNRVNVSDVRNPFAPIVSAIPTTGGESSTGEDASDLGSPE